MHAMAVLVIAALLLAAAPHAHGQDVSDARSGPVAHGQDVSDARSGPDAHGTPPGSVSRSQALNATLAATIDKYAAMFNASLVAGVVGELEGRRFA